MGLIIAVGFDGAIVRHEFPKIGAEIPGAIDWLKKYQKDHNAKIILWTMRSNCQADGDVLHDAVEFCRSRGLEFWGVNENPEQGWSDSPKAYANTYIDDAAFGCPLLHDIDDLMARPFVDWGNVGPNIHALAMAANGELSTRKEADQPAIDADGLQDPSESS